MDPSNLLLGAASILFTLLGILIGWFLARRSNQRMDRLPSETAQAVVAALVAQGIVPVEREGEAREAARLAAAKVGTIVAGGNEFVLTLADALLKHDPRFQETISEKRRALQNVRLPRRRISPSGRIEVAKELLATGQSPSESSE
jgi:uncharacterized protein YneF (UPF0154 family)